MEDPGTLIYVAFLVISLIAGWYRNRKKNQEGKVNSDAPELVKEGDSLEQVPSFTSQEIERSMADKLKMKNDAKARLRELMADPRLQEKKADKRSAAKEAKEAQSVLDSSSTNDDEIFDARKAFIYSEIFNAPYI
jgi:hypothetical protein